jgi:hypothetical protein
VAVQAVLYCKDGVRVSSKSNSSSLQAKRGFPERPETNVSIKSEVSIVFYSRSYYNQSASLICKST